MKYSLTHCYTDKNKGDAAIIGTRLHSVIFALSVSVPSINIAYHGTKAQGILKQVGDMSRFVIDINTVDSAELLDKIQELYENREAIKPKLQEQVAELNRALEVAMGEIIYGRTT